MTGRQMRAMASTLVADSDILDVASYLTTLEKIVLAGQEPDGRLAPASGAPDTGVAPLTRWVEELSL